MWYMIRNIITTNVWKIIAALGAAIVWIAYIFNTYMRERAEHRAENAEAELERLTQSHEAQVIIDDSCITADKLVEDVERLSDDILDKSGDDLSDDLGALFNDKRMHPKG